MKWFDTSFIRDRENLTPDQIEYLTKPSVNLFAPFYIIVRNHWDLFLAMFLLNGVGRAINETQGEIGPVFWLIYLVYLAGLMYTYYFGVKHCRRLSWNRGKAEWFKRKDWESFEEFKKSEKRWKPWGVVGIVLLLLIFFSSF